MIPESTFVSKKATKKNTEGALGFEPRAYRTAADCSTTELYPRLMKSGAPYTSVFPAKSLKRKERYLLTQPFVRTDNPWF